MPELDRPRPVTTVATIVVRDGAFLLVEEETRAGVRLNQPAGHLEAGETPGRRRDPRDAGGNGLSRHAHRAGRHLSLAGAGDRRDVHPLRFCRRRRRARADRTLDEGILRALWLSYDDLIASRDQHRSPLVLRCVDDFRAGVRRPLDFVTEL